MFPFLNTLVPELRNNLFWQTDSCAAHFTFLVRQFLYYQLPEKWKDRFGPNHYPSRTPNITPFDFIFWGDLKQREMKKMNHTPFILYIFIYCTMKLLSDQNMCTDGK